ncbi:MAG: bifunctional phosphopantothenoylcysteine decarboxylase/phosphopantothenate synthase [Candidatus Latescibacteria bacterium]|nr:bifunctional phosphopantothenoylcysteine decarboxylase/phosphopantothenate synthase [Candidatus Latescibacterota bacterium]
MTEARSGLDQSRVLLGVTGGVAAYKTPELIRLLAKEGAHVSVVMTRNARRFVTRDALKSVTHGPVLTGLFEAQALGEGPWFEGSPPSTLGMAHIGMAREADLVLVAPATANLLAKLARGLADDLLSTALLATRAPILLAPAMNVAMWEHPAVQENARILRDRGVRFVGPEEGELADGEWGMGRMAPLEAIVEATRDALEAGGMSRRAEAAPPRPQGIAISDQALRGRTIVVTAGGTEEPIDPVRVITNRSSGKMGFALAEEARRMGARVTLITARTSAPAPVGIARTEALTVSAMAGAVREAMRDADALIMAAAVSDFTPGPPSGSKIKRAESGVTLELKATQDILRAVRSEFPKKHLVGFALETGDEERAGREKLERKGLDLIAINNPLKPGAGFGSDQNDVTLIDRSGALERLGLRSKRDVARAILERVARALAGKAAR